MSLCAELTKLQRKENFDTNPDPDPECLLICHMRSNMSFNRIFSSKTDIIG